MDSMRKVLFAISAVGLGLVGFTGLAGAQAYDPTTDLTSIVTDNGPMLVAVILGIVGASIGFALLRTYLPKVVRLITGRGSGAAV